MFFFFFSLSLFISSVQHGLNQAVAAVRAARALVPWCSPPSGLMVTPTLAETSRGGPLIEPTLTQ